MYGRECELFEMKDGIVAGTWGIKGLSCKMRHESDGKGQTIRAFYMKNLSLFLDSNGKALRV